MANEHEIAQEELAEPETEAVREETPVSQPEAEPAEVAEEAPQPEQDAPVTAEAKSEAGCPIKMGSSALRCGRKLHATPAGVDERPVCLMHSKDTNKQSGQLFHAFWLEFERILEDAGENEAHFERFLFPEADFSGRKFKANCRFKGATFTKDADFGGATFTQNADFEGATFTQYAYFSGATFTQYAYFGGATFTQYADFEGATFTQDAVFWGTTFTQNTDFTEATFTQNVDFFYVTFTQNADFNRATFMQNAEFSSATFTQDADFSATTFTQDANFIKTTFIQNADFSKAIFIQSAKFWNTTFTRNADFERTRFCGMVDWHECRFFDQVEFRHTEFNPKAPKIPNAIFSLARFFKPEESIFEDVDLSRALFNNCDVSAVWFTSSVQWARRKGHRGLAVFEEEILLDPKLAEILKLYGKIDHGAVEQTYHLLQKNYDSRLDYRKANDFHYGEMEMRRLAVPVSRWPQWPRRWQHRKWNFIALYRWASDYGNSYQKPLWWLLGIVLGTALLFPITGLEWKQPKPGNAAGNAIVTYHRVWNRQDTWSNNLWTEGKLIGKSGITAIDTATFQRNPEYSPVYPRGRILGILETLLTSSLLALFLLAIRRQFRR